MANYCVFDQLCHQKILKISAEEMAPLGCIDIKQNNSCHICIYALKLNFIHRHNIISKNWTGTNRFKEKMHLFFLYWNQLLILQKFYACNCYYKINIRIYLLAHILLHWTQDSTSIPKRWQFYVASCRQDVMSSEI